MWQESAVSDLSMQAPHAVTASSIDTPHVAVTAPCTPASCGTQVRFFERVKIERHIKHLEREGAQAGGLAAADEAQLAQWRADLQVRGEGRERKPRQGGRQVGRAGGRAGGQAGGQGRGEGRVTGRAGW